MLLINSTSYGLANTGTFRRASKQLFGKYGSNMQNPSPGMMKIYRPKLDTNIFLQPDQKGAEALIVSYLAPPGRLRDIFKYSQNAHAYTASHIFKSEWINDGYSGTPILNLLPIEKLKDNEEWKRLVKHIKATDDVRHRYFIGKKSGHSFNYRMRPSTFREDVLKESDGEVAITKHESELFHAIYHSQIYPEVSQGWWPELEYQVIKTNYLYNLFGYPLFCNYYEGMQNKDKFWREVTAKVPQSTVGCLNAIAFCEVQEYIEAHKLASEWHLRNDKHDSILLECPERHKDDAIPVLQKAIEQHLKSPRGEEFQMKSEISWGRNWKKFNEKDNPLGMREI